MSSRSVGAANGSIPSGKCEAAPRRAWDRARYLENWMSRTLAAPRSLQSVDLPLPSRLLPSASRCEQ